MGCDLCGADATLREVRIEGTIMNACARCGAHGEPVPQPPRARMVRRELPTRTERLLIVRDDFGQEIKRARERRGLKQEDLARELRIKASQLHKYESGAHRPDIETARLLERQLKIRLVEEHVEEGGSSTTAAAPMTIGDLLR